MPSFYSVTEDFSGVMHYVDKKIAKEKIMESAVLIIMLANGVLLTGGLIGVSVKIF